MDDKEKDPRDHPIKESGEIEDSDEEQETAEKQRKPEPREERP